MLKMIKGSIINDADKLSEGFAIEEDSIVSNINEDKILKIMNEFIDMQKNPLFLIIEIPTKLENENVKENVIDKFHNDVYYLDNMSNEAVKNLLKNYGSLFINDGLAQIGVGNHITNAEIMTNKYNVVTIFNGKDEIVKYEQLLNNCNIKKVDKLVTAWDYFNDENPGNSISIKENGKDVYDIVEKLKKESGLYFAERRECF